MPKLKKIREMPFTDEERLENLQRRYGAVLQAIQNRLNEIAGINKLIAHDEWCMQNLEKEIVELRAKIKDDKPQ